jgi:hypothetical protein
MILCNFGWIFYLQWKQKTQQILIRFEYIQLLLGKVKKQSRADASSTDFLTT